MPRKLKATPFPIELLDEPFIPARYRVGNGNGFTFAGSTIVDTCVSVNKPPAVDSLVFATGTKVRATGGMVLNNAIAMKKLDPNIDVLPIGFVGENIHGEVDADGRFIMNRLQAHGMSSTGLRRASDKDTSYTDIPTAGGKKVFIHGHGACDAFGLETFPVQNFEPGTIVLVGYINLLRKLMVRGGRGAQKLIKLLVSLESYVGVDFTDIYDAGFQKLFSASVGNCHFVTTNEMSLSNGVGVNVYRKNGELDEAKLLLAAQTAVDCFKHLQWMAIHWPTGGMFYTNKHQVITYPVHILKKGDKVGATGAGDNWNQAFLAAAFMGKGPLFALHLATTAAAKSLGALSATDASGSLEELKAFDAARKLFKMTGLLADFYPASHPLDWSWWKWTDK